MSDPVHAELATACQGRVVADASLAALTTLRVGGAARVLVTAECDADLEAVSAVCHRHGLPWAVIGRGSNLLVADAGWPGVAVGLGRGVRGVALAGSRVVAGAAEPLPSLAVRIADAGLGGFAWGCAVPGTLGGAVRMNAGAHGGDMASHLTGVEVFRLSSATREQWPVSALGLSYRHSELPGDAVVLQATMSLAPAQPADIRAEIDSIRAWRRAHQPLNEPNCGSVFTNPPGESAGRLIDTAGCKGRSVGGATVSQRHANFIVTRPGATATDVATLIVEVVTAVERRHGVTLHPEVRRLGAVEVDRSGGGAGASGS